MTREEIYEEGTLKNIGNNPQGTRMDVVYSEMDEYAKQQSIAFAEFIFKGGYTVHLFFYEWMWVKRSLSVKDVSTLLTTQQLYDQFLSQQTKE